MKESYRPPVVGREAHALAWTVLLLVGTALFTLSFQRWGHPIIDLGRDLYVPSQLLGGRVLYRQVLYNYGPVASYLLAALTAVAGDSLRVFAAFGLTVGVLSTTVIYAIGNRLGGVVTAFSAAMLFVTLSLFAGSTWGANFVLPYAFAATLGTLFSLGSFLFLIRHLYGERHRRDLIVSLALLLAAVFTKVEIGLAIGLVHLLAWWAHRLPVRPALVTAGIGLGAAGLGAAAFTARNAGEHTLWSENLGRFVGGGAGGEFFAVVAGTEAPLRHLGEAVVAAVGLWLIIALAAFAGRRLTPTAGEPPGGQAITLAAVGACTAIVWLGADVRWMRIVPFAAVALVVFLMRRNRHDPLLLVAAYAIFSAPRIVLQYHPLWYGFYLAVPGYLLLTYGLGKRLPHHIRGRRLALAALTVTMCLAVWRYTDLSSRTWLNMTSTLETAQGTLRDRPNGRAEAIAGFLDWWRQRPAPGDETLVVLPEGVSLNYLTGAQNPTAYYLFTPPEIGSADVERRMLAELEAAVPDFVVMTSRDVGEFGFTGIGLDYALEIGDWLRRDYSVVRWFHGRNPEGWRLLLLRRNE